jgi:hypothetical protein
MVLKNKKGCTRQLSRLIDANNYAKTWQIRTQNCNRESFDVGKLPSTYIFVGIWLVATFHALLGVYCSMVLKK